MAITAQMVSQLREQTGAGMMECKKALVETDGDLAKARDLLRTRGKAGAEKRAARSAAEGVVAAFSAPEGVALVELNSETDFVARNEEFQALAGCLAEVAATRGLADTDAILSTSLADGTNVRHRLDDLLTKLRENIVFRRASVYAAGTDSVLANYVHRVTNKIGVIVELKGDPGNAALADLARNVAMHVAASKPEYLRREDVPAEAVEAEKKVLADLTRNEGKPESAIPKIVEGRLGKFYERTCLVDQPYVREPGTKVGALVKDAGAEIARFTLYVVGQE